MNAPDGTKIAERWAGAYEGIEFTEQQCDGWLTREDKQAKQLIEELSRSEERERVLREALAKTEARLAEIRIMQHRGATVEAYGCHVSPDRKACEANRRPEPEGERLRDELEAWLEKNAIVGILMDTKGHLVRVTNAPPLPNDIKAVLTYWGSIYVRDDAALATPAPEPAPEEKPCPKCKGRGLIYTANGSSICPCSEGWDNNDEG